MVDVLSQSLEVQKALQEMSQAFHEVKEQQQAQVLGLS
jgi:hypothetical protein